MGIKSLRFNTRTLNFIHFLLLILFFSSCTLQKRLYTKGLYTYIHQIIKKPESKSDLKLLALINRSKKIQLLVPDKTLDNGCDSIVLKNGTKIACTITEIKQRKIRFKNCSSSEYLTSSIDKADVSFLSFANGIQQTNDFKIIYPQPKNKTNGLAITGIIASVLALCFLLLFFSGFQSGIAMLFLAIIFFIAGSTLSISSVMQISRESGNKKGFILGIIGIIISLAFIVTALLHIY